MANLIDASDYQTLADYLGAARDAVIGADGVTQNLFDAVYAVVMLQAIYPEVDLLDDFWSTYQLSSNEFNTPASLLEAVRALNSHVLTRSQYTTLNDYWTAKGITASSTFQDLCTEAGYSVT